VSQLEDSDVSVVVLELGLDELDSSPVVELVVVIEAVEEAVVVAVLEDTVVDDDVEGIVELVEEFVLDKAT
jgi:hypothetical protein